MNLWYMIAGCTCGFACKNMACSVSAGHVQAQMLREMMLSQRVSSGTPGMLSSTDLRGLSNQVQRKAAKVLEFPYTLAAGEGLNKVQRNSNLGIFAASDGAFAASEG